MKSLRGLFYVGYAVLVIGVATTVVPPIYTETINVCSKALSQLERAIVQATQR